MELVMECANCYHELFESGPCWNCGHENTIGLWYIHKYEIALVYGGPEEGGWWYNAGNPTGMRFGPFEAWERDAIEQCYVLNTLEKERRKREEDYDYHSVLAYRSTHYEYDVTMEPIARAFPQERPHYE